MSQTIENPFLRAYNTPFGTPPFDQIRAEHYLPAMRESMRLHKLEVEAIVNNLAEPDFFNTIEALERSGEVLSRVQYVFYNLLSAETNDTLQQIAEEIAPEESEHSNNIFLNEKLFARVKRVMLKHEDKQNAPLSLEMRMLLDKTYDSFVRRGANLSEAGKEAYRELSKELSLSGLQFGQNVLKATNAFTLIIKEKEQLAGIPADILDAAREKAKIKNEEGWLFDLTAPSYVPFMKYAENRDLRRQLYMAYNSKALGDEFDNQELVKKLVNLRLETAQLLGYKNCAEFVLRKRMAENEQNVYGLLNDLLNAYKPKAQEEIADVQEFAKQKGANFELMPWDWSFYSDKLKEEKYSVNDELTKPYFELENVKKGVFGLATRLFGLQFRKNTEISVYNPDVEVFEVFDDAGKFLSVLYTDFHPRESKRGGAWMTEFKPQWKADGINHRPQISLVMNFTRATDTQPALLTFDEFTTFLHEFGHALHGMLANCTYESLSGTNVYRDFVEMPSQILENYATEKEFLDGFAVHYKTGEKIPTELIAKIKAAENFNIGYACLRQLSFGYLDMAWHTLTQPFEGDVSAFERQAWAKAQTLPSVDGTCMSVQFSHIFSGGYAAGYYSYKWSEVLDADAFSVFKENGIFDVKTATSFRENILSKGGSEHPMTLYMRFRGQKPTIDALLIRNGVK